MRIAYVTVDPGIPVFGTKGASVHIQEVVRELIRRGHDVTVHTTRAGDDIPDDLAGLEMIETRIDADDPGARERAQQEVSARIAARIIAGGVDLVYERYSLFSTALAEVAEATGAAGILEVNAPLIEEQRTHRVLVDEEAAAKALAHQVAAATATVAVSDPARDWVRERTGSESVHTVPNGVSITRIVPRPEDIGDPVVTFVGTLKPWHGVADLLAAAALAKRPWKLRIIGDGPERAALEEQAAGLGIEVDFRGAVAPADMPGQLAGSAIGVAPYPDLGGEQQQYFSPLKVYEYLAAGLPVVASAVGQLPQILGELGTLVSPSDPAALAAAIDTLAADPVLRGKLGWRGRMQAEEKHSWAGAVDRILGLAGRADG